MRCFSIAMNRITTGMVASSEAANRYCHSIILKEENCVIPTVIGRFDAVEIRTVEIVYSFQALIKTKTVSYTHLTLPTILLV